MKGIAKRDERSHLDDFDLPPLTDGFQMSIGRIATICMAAVLLLLGIIVAPALADEDESAPGQPYPLAGVEEAAGESNYLIDQLIDPKAAKELPHRGLDRGEASDLLQGVFGPLLESSSGPFDDLSIDHFLADNVAIVNPTQPDGAVTVGGEKAAEEEAENATGPLLLDSTLPLRTENDLGQDRPVDLDLEQDEGELQPANPLVEVGIPTELGEGVSLPSGTLELDTQSTTEEERAPSILADNVAFYPNVAQDTDFAVATTPTGIETFTQIRSAEAPQSQTLQLSLDQSAVLEGTDDGGAVAMSGGEEVLKVMPPSAIDANGNSVPASLEVSGGALRLSAETDEATAFPVLLDPVIIESWPWNEKNTTIGMDQGNEAGTGDWRSWHNTSAYGVDNHVPWGSVPSPLKPNMPGLTVTSGWQGTVSVGSQGNWNYYVPRYFTDYEKYGTRPTSFIQNMQMWNLQYEVYTTQSSPWLAVGLWDENLKKWVSVYSRNGTEGSLTEKYWSYLYNFPNGEYVQSAKNAGFGLLSSEAGANSGRLLYAGYAALSLNDLTNPSIGSISGPEKWVNNSSIEPVKVTASDSGLGMKSILIEGDNKEGSFPLSLQCTGVAKDPCPRTWNAEWSYPAASLFNGIHKFTVTALDVLGNKSQTAKVQIKVDHMPPSLTLSGSLTQQATYGYQRPSYLLHLDASDGTTASPQAGIASSQITVDGKEVDASNPGCATQNCTLSRDWTLKSASFAPGEHTVVATVTDGAGVKTSKTLTIKIQADTTPPTLETWGDLREAPDGWVEQEGSGVEALAEDGTGYGVTSVSLRIDGKVVKSFDQSCTYGACYGALEASVDMAAYTGGAHSAELVAKDGAGNVSKDSWTINVNPSGVVPSSEATATIEAADETGEGSVVAPTSEVVDPAEIKEGNNPGLAIEGSNLESTGTGADSSMTVDAGDGFTIDNGKETFHIEPAKTTSSETDLEVANGVAGVAGNTTSGVDTVVRPIYDGIMAFQSIRMSTAPEGYSWEVQLHQEQELKVIDEGHAGVFYPDGTLALTITAEIAHDATGKEVPTSLSVSEGNVLTLTVHHQGKGFTYPVTAGPAWSTGYETVIVSGPPTKQEEEEEMARELAEQHARECAEGKAGCGLYAPVAYESVGPPIPLPSNNTDDEGASASSIRPHYKRHWSYNQCAYEGLGGCFVWYLPMEGTFEFNHKYAWWKNEKPHPKCPYSAHAASISESGCDWIGPNHQPDKKGGYHISAQVLYHVAPVNAPSEIYEPITEYMYASGYASGHNTDALCNPTVSCE